MPYTYQPVFCPELDPQVAGGVRVGAVNLVPELCRLGVLRQDLRQDRLLDVAALDQVLSTPFEFFQSRGEVVVVWFEEFLDHRVLTRQDRSEAQRQDGRRGNDRVQDLLMGFEIFRCAPR